MRPEREDQETAQASTLIELLRRRSQQQPELRLYTFLSEAGSEGASLTCAELDRRARAIGALLQTHGASGQRVLLLYPAGVEFIAAFFGCLYAGAIAVPAPSPDPDRPGRTLTRLRSIAADCQPEAVLTTSSVLATARESFARAAELSGVRWLATDGVASDLGEKWRDPGVAGDTLAYLQYTSGSTALPKGVMVTHANILHNSAGISQAWSYGPDSVAVVWVPQFHDDGLVHGIIQPLYRGFRSFFMSPLAFIQQPIRWLQAITRFQATHSGGPNFAYTLCVRKIPQSQRAALDLSRWRVAYNAAEPIRRETLEQFAEAFRPSGFRWNAFYPAYGLAEATLLVSTRRASDEPVFSGLREDAPDQVSPTGGASSGEPHVRTLVGCGHAVRDTKIVIAHPETMTRCAAGEVGEIWVSDPSVARGYWNRPEETAQTFRAFLSDTGEGPFLRTGDLGFLKAEELFVSGRIKDLIIIRGQNHYPQDIEWTVQESHPALRPGCCAAFSVDASGEEQLVLLAEVQRRDPQAPPRALDYEAVVGAIRQAVSEQHGLHAYVVLLLEPGTIPKTSSGKLQRHACRAGFLAGTLNVVGEVGGFVPEPAGRGDTVGETGREPIAIVGLGCRFPGATSPEAFWRLLRDGEEAVTEVPPDRWDVDAFYDPVPGAPRKMNTRRGGFLKNVDLFDARFFGISPREAVRLDPQQRLLLEVAFEALEDAGLVPERLTGSRTGVFIGYASNDYGRIQMDPSLCDAYMPTGNAGSIAANRLSYVFDFRGPSMIVDTACSSSLVAVHLACESIWKAESTLALVGGVNLILSPVSTINFSKAGMLSPDGRCKAFDASANGYVRGEGAGVIVLKPLSRALHDGDPIYALIRSSAVNQDGRSDGLTVPSQEAQEAVILEACRQAGISPGQIDYIEAHGTGTPVGDPIEANALGRVLSIGRAPGRHCALGSVKTNIAHLEAASGIAGLIKLALMLRHRQIPPSLHFREPNPRIPFDRLPLRVQTTLGPWPAKSEPALAGVNSFGFGGTNAHVILEEAPRAETAEPPAPAPTSHRAHLIPLSARSPEALQALAKAYLDLLAAGPEDSTLSLGDLAYTAGLRRGHHDHRLALVSHSLGELKEQIGAFLQGTVRPDIVTGRRKYDHSPKIVFVFPGQGPQWWAMGRHLLEKEPVFRATLEKCDGLLRRYADWSLLEELGADEPRSRLGETAIAQPALFALQMALAEQWRAWGIVPDAVVGHSMGEVAAACVAGAIDLEDAVRIIFHRSRLMQQATGRGKMAAVTLSPEDAQRALAGYEGRVGVASINGPTSVVLSGEPAALDEILRSLEQRGIPSRFLPVNYAFHSHQMEPFLGELTEALQGIQPRSSSCPIVSTVTGTACDGLDFGAGYWRRNVREPVRFAAAIDALARDGHGVFLELSPHPTLVGSIAQCLSASGKGGDALPSLRRGEEDGMVMLGSVGALYALGCPVDWARLQPTRGRQVRLPSYPWQRERFWLEIQAADFSPQSWSDQSGTKKHPLLNRHLKSAHPAWETDLDRQSLPYLVDHRVQGEVLLPATAYVEVALAAAEASGSVAPGLAEVEFQKPLFLPDGEARKVQIILAPGLAGEASFEIFSRTGGTGLSDEAWACHARGKIKAGKDDRVPPASEPADFDAIRARCPESITAGDFYRDLGELGLQYGPAFQGVEQIWRRDGEALGRLQLPQGCEPGHELYQFHPALLDAALQVLAAAVPARAASGGDGGVYLPVRMDQIRMYGRPGLRVWSHARLRPRAGHSAGELEGEIRVLDEAGRLIAEISGFHLQRVDHSALPASDEDPRAWLYQQMWELKARPGEEPVHPPARYLRSPREIAGRLRSRLTSSGTPAGLEPYLALGDQAESMVIAYIVQAFRRLGWALDLHQRLPVASSAEQLGVAPQQRRYLGRLLERLAEESVLRQTGTDWEVCRVPATQDPEELWKSLMAQFPACEADLTVLGQCGRHLAEVLRGACDPLQLIFPEGSLTTAEHMYQDSPFARAYNTLAQDALRAALERQPAGRAIRILEIGAGTGAMTATVLPALPADRTEYISTDISPLFLSHGQAKFRRYPFVQHRRLDIERDPGEQGFGAHQFDVILASHVLHATSDLRRTLRHIRHLMTPEGLLILLEGDGLCGHYDLVFGMTEGWWKFADFDVRPTHPLLSHRQWTALLAEAGFEEAVAVPAPENRTYGDWTRQIVVMARGPHVEREIQPLAASRIKPESPGTWLVFTDSGSTGPRLAKHLESLGERCVMVRPADTYGVEGPDRYGVDPARPDDFHRLLQDTLGPDRPPCRGVIHLWSLDSAPPQATTVASLQASQVLGCGSVLHLVQALTEGDRPTLPRLWLVTAGTQWLEAGTEPLSVAQAPLRGLASVIVTEHPELRCTSVDLSPAFASDEIESLLLELWADEREEHIALRGPSRHVLRLVRRSPDGDARGRTEASADQPYRLEITTPGIFDNLTLRATSHREPAPGQVEIQVHAAGLNFRDVLKAMGMYPTDPGEPMWLGDECAGTVVALGEGVTGLDIGDDVIAVAPACFGRFATTPAPFVVRKPAHLSFEEAATIPVAFLTAHYALHHLGRLRRGERVLIHAAAGGVGLAAVQIAQKAGAEIFATAGSPAKREFLKSLGVAHVMDSRSLAFADDIMERTGGQGVDIVLNSLAGEFIPRSLATLRAHGRFLEIGKRDIYEHHRLDMSFLKNNVSFFAIDLATVFRDQHAFSGEMLRHVMEGFEDRTLKPLPVQAFPIADYESAFRYMAQAKHVGKVVLSLQGQRVSVSPAPDESIRFGADRTYLVTGGLGGVGLTVAQWMARQGARHLVLMGRSAPSPSALEILETTRRSGVEVVVAQADVTREHEVAQVIRTITETMPPLGGVIHAAMVLDDGAIRQLSLERLQKVMAPKMIGAWNLHSLTVDKPLDFFVLFSSSAALVGSPGQANYVAANVAVDALAHHRRARGLPAMSINWGRLGGVGYVARHEEIGQRLDRLGVKAFTTEQMLTMLGRLLQANPTQVGAMRIDWRLWGSTFRAAGESLYLSHLMQEGGARETGEAGSGILAALRGTAPEEWQKSLEAYVQQEIARSLRLDPSQIDLRQSLGSIGLDSLMGLELKNRFQTDLGVDLPMTTLMQNPTIAQLASTLLALLPAPDSTSGAARSGAEQGGPPLTRVTGPGQSRQPATTVDQLSDHEVDSLLEKLLAEESTPTDGVRP